jgi:hypothetical protein
LEGIRWLHHLSRRRQLLHQSMIFHHYQVRMKPSMQLLRRE